MSEIIQLDPERISRRATDFKIFLESRVIGQKRAIKRLVQAYDFALSPMRDSKKPIIVAPYFGPSGCGKTHLARCVAEFFFEDSEAMTKIDCTKFVHGHEVSTLVGSPAGYIGYKDPPRLSQYSIEKPAYDYLQSRLRYHEELRPTIKKLARFKALHDFELEKPDSTNGDNPYLDKLVKDMAELETIYRTKSRKISAQILRKSNGRYFSIILFDEFEKAHPNLHDNIMDIGSSGELVLMNNETTSFADSFIFLTSNLGSKSIDKLLRGGSKGVGFSANSKQSTKDSIYTTVLEELKKFFKTEFLGRLQHDIIVFRALKREEMEEILERFLGKICFDLRSRVGAKLKIEDGVKNQILEDALEHPEYGARPLEQAVEHMIEKPLARLASTGQVEFKDDVSVILRDGQVAFVKSAKPPNRSNSLTKTRSYPDDPPFFEELDFNDLNLD